MKTYVYNVGALRKLIAESSNEFKPVIGNGVESDNKSNNGKAYKDAEKKVKDFDGGLSKSEKSSKLPDKEDFNRTTLDYNPRVEPDKEWKDKVEAQAKGYTSKLEQDNKIEKSGEFDNNGKILKHIKSGTDKIQKERNAIATSGLVSKEMKSKGEIKEKPTMTESVAPKAKRLVFKKTRFLNESQMLARIPEMYKIDKQIIYMNDAHNNEYVVECVKSDTTGVVETNIVSFKNKEVLSEQKQRIQELFDYKTSSTSGKNVKSNKLNEDETFRMMLDIARGKK